jgi:hypothetical protein
MNSEQFMKLLDRLGACDDAKQWAEGKDFAEVYATCHRGDWLAWLYQKTNPTNKRKLVLIGGLFANQVRHLMNDERSIAAVDVCLRYGRGDATDEELAAARATRAATRAAAMAAAEAAWDAARAAWYAAMAAAEAAWYAARAAWYAAWAARGAARAAAEDAALRSSADIFRENVKIEDFNLTTQ